MFRGLGVRSFFLPSIHPFGEEQASLILIFDLVFMWVPSKEPFLLNLPRYVEHDKKHLDTWNLIILTDDNDGKMLMTSLKVEKVEKVEKVTCSPRILLKMSRSLRSLRANVTTQCPPTWKTTTLLLLHCYSERPWLAAFFLVLKLGVPVRKNHPVCCCAWATVSKYVCVQKAFPYMSEHDWVTLLFSLAISSASSRRKLLLKRSSVEWPSTTAAKPILKVQSSFLSYLWLPWKWLNDKRWVLWSWTYKRIPPTH